MGNVTMAMARVTTVDTTGLTAVGQNTMAGPWCVQSQTPGDDRYGDDRSVKPSCFKYVPTTNICIVSRRWVILINI